MLLGQNPESSAPCHDPYRSIQICIDRSQLRRNTHALRFLVSSISGPISDGFLGSTYADSRSSPQRAPIVTQTCLAGMGTFLVSRAPVHRNLLSRLMSLFPIPLLVFHSLMMSRMNSTFRRKWFAVGMPCNSGLISGRLRVGLLVLRVPARGAGCLGGAVKFKRVWSGYERTVLPSRADSASEPVSSSRLAASCGRCQKWHHVPVESITILVWSGKLNCTTS